MVISDGIPVVPRNRKSRNSVPNPSAEEKTTRNSFPCNKKLKYTLGMPLRTIPWKRNQLKAGIFKRLRSPGIDSASLFSPAGRYCKPIPTWFLAPIDCSTIPAQNKTRQPNISIIVLEKTTFDVQSNHFVILLLFRQTNFLPG